MSLNNMYQGRHWGIFYRLVAAEKNRMYAELSQMGIHPMDRAVIFKTRVDISVLVFFKYQPLDPDNIAVKPYIDALKYILFPDDNRKSVRSVSLQSEVDYQNPRLELTIKEVENDKTYKRQ